MDHPALEKLLIVGARRVAIVSVFSALAITTDYAMLPLPNVKLMDTIVFVSAMVFGFSVGVSVSALAWLVYGSINPLGSAGGPLLVILMASETIYAFLGYGARRLFGSQENGIPARSLMWGSLGLIGAFLYDLSTIITPALVAGTSFGVALASLVPAMPFILAHEISDFAFFATAAPLLVISIDRIAKKSFGLSVSTAEAVKTR
jgi:hypothetical protein